MAPELMFDEEYNTKADMYSLGVVLAEVLVEMAGHEGFLARSPAAKFALDLTRFAKGSRLITSLAELCRQCLALEPDEHLMRRMLWNGWRRCSRTCPRTASRRAAGMSTSGASIAGAERGGDTAGAIADAAAADASDSRRRARLVGPTATLGR